MRISKKKGILVIGGEGHLGSILKKIEPTVIALGKKDADVTSLSSLQNAIQKYKPNYIINCAAITDMVYCQKHPVQCFRVNSDGVKNIKSAIGKKHIKLIHISSDAAINPVSVYGKAKKGALCYLDGEDLGITTTYFSDNTYLVQGILAGKKVCAYDDMFFNPVSILFLAQQILTHKDTRGELKIFSNRKISKYAFGRLVAEVFQKKETCIGEIHYDKKIDAMYKKDSCIMPDIGIDLEKDMQAYKEFLHI